MRRRYWTFCILSVVLGLCGLSLAEGNDSEKTKAQAIQNIRDARDDLVQKRTLAYYVAEERAPKGEAKETVAINTGSLILAGRFLAPPYEVCLGNDFIAINGVAVEPRFTISGEMQQQNLSETNQARVASAELIAQKRTALYEETGDYTLVIPELVSYAKSLDSVQDVRVDGDMVTVTFASNGATSEVGYICREMRKPSSFPKASLLDQEYRDICAWLRKGNCVFVPMKGPPRPESPSVPKAINALVDRKANPKAARQQLQRELALVSDCFATPVAIDDAVVITANWHRSDLLQ